MSTITHKNIKNEKWQKNLPLKFKIEFLIVQFQKVPTTLFWLFFFFFFGVMGRSSVFVSVQVTIRGELNWPIKIKKKKTQAPFQACRQLKNKNHSSSNRTISKPQKRAALTSEGSPPNIQYTKLKKKNHWHWKHVPARVSDWLC